MCCDGGGSGALGIVSVVNCDRGEEREVREMGDGRLAKILMMSFNQRLNMVKLNELKRNFGFPDDYLTRIVPNYPEMFRLINYNERKSSLELELVSWNSELATSCIEISTKKHDTEPSFSCSLPSTWIKTWERFNEFNSTPYISPHTNSSGLVEGSKEHGKRAVALVHELLSMTLWRKLSILKLGHFIREFVLPEEVKYYVIKTSWLILC